MEENKEVLKNTEAPAPENKETVATEEVKFTEVEERAGEQGWQPLKEWTEAGHDPAEWRDARSFLDRGELLSRISQQSKEMKELRRTLKTFEEHNKKLAATKFEEKYQELKQEKKAALESGDADRVVELDEQMDLVRDHMAENKAQATETVTPEIHPDFQRWMDRNSWYGQDEEMRMFADNVGTSYAKLNRDKSPADVLKYVETRVKKAYSDKFVNSRKDAPNTVEAGSGTRRAGRPSSDAEASLTPEAKQVMDTLVRAGHMTKEEYLKQYALFDKR